MTIASSSRRTGASERRGIGRIAPRRARRRHSLLRRRAAAQTLERIAKGGGPIVAGPWLDGVGIELLYWIPLLRWLTSTGGVDPGRVVAISRGGADAWYSDVAGRYVDVLDHYTPSDLRRWRRQRDSVSENELRGRLHALAGHGDAESLHPSILHQLFAPRWDWGAPASIVASHTEHAFLPTDTSGHVPDIPDSYVAVKAYFNRAFPYSPENQAALERIVAALAERTDVVLLSTPELDRISFDPDPDLPVTLLSGEIASRHSLGIQGRVVRGARVLVAPYGGFSYLGPYVGTTTLAIYSEANFPIAHLDAIDRVGRRLSSGGNRLFRARHVGSLEFSEPVM